MVSGRWQVHRAVTARQHRAGSTLVTATIEAGSTTPNWRLETRTHPGCRPTLPAAAKTRSKNL